jgi:hypothetical protein
MSTQKHLLFQVLMAAALFAQSAPTTSLSGTVSDPSGRRFQFVIVPPTRYDLQVMAAGWQTSGIWSWRSGLPVNVTSGQDRSLSGINLDRGDQTGESLSDHGPGEGAVDRRLVQYIRVRAGSAGDLRQQSAESAAVAGILQHRLVDFKIVPRDRALQHAVARRLF